MAAPPICSVAGGCSSPARRSLAISSLAAGVAGSEGMLIGARLVQGLGAAMMMPAALSILTTSFHEGSDRNKALGAWGALAGLASAVGVFLGGVLSEGPGWRWVFFVNLPVCALILVAAFRLISGERHRARLANFDTPGAILVTVRDAASGLRARPRAGRRLGHGADDRRARRRRRTARRVRGQRAAPAKPARSPVDLPHQRTRPPPTSTQVIAMAGFYSMFFFITLYMQNVLGFSQIQAGAAYVPVTFGVAISAGICSQLFARTGTRPIIVAGALLGAGGVYWLSRIPVHGSYLTDLLPGLMIMSLGLGAVFVGVTTAAQRRRAPRQGRARRRA